MTSPQPPGDEAIRGVVTQSHDDFKKRMLEIEEIFRTRRALLVAEYLEELKKEEAAGQLDLKKESLAKRIARYTTEHSDDMLNDHALNEATVVLLSAYLEEFLEQLHAGALRQLLNEKVVSAKVTESLLEYVQERFGNPTPDKIAWLFSTCGISDVVSSVKMDTKEIRDFVQTRNKVAHGEHVSVASKDVAKWYRLVLEFASALSSHVQDEIIALKLGK
jgi:hypothetical protein